MGTTVFWPVCSQWRRERKVCVRPKESVGTLLDPILSERPLARANSRPTLHYWMGHFSQREKLRDAGDRARSTDRCCADSHRLNGSWGSPFRCSAKRLAQPRMGVVVTVETTGCAVFTAIEVLSVLGRSDCGSAREFSNAA